MWKLRWGKVLSACVTAALLLSACGDKLPTSPETYELNGEDVPSFHAVLGGDDSGTLTEMETAEDPTSSAAPSAETADLGENRYVYKKLDGGGSAVSQYAESLTSGSGAFTVVNEDAEQTDPPDYTAESGAVILARAAAQAGKILKLEISWTADTCRIVMTRADGAVKPAAEAAMTNAEAVEYLRGLQPTDLGLSGSMQEYRIYPIEGQVKVNGIACLKLQAYQVGEPAHTNQIAGVFLLSGDKAHLYRLENGQAMELHAA